MLVRLACLVLIGLYGLFNLVWFHGLKIDDMTQSFSRSSFKVNPAKVFSIGVGIWLRGSPYQETDPADVLQLLNATLDSTFLTLNRTIVDPSYRYRFYIISFQSQHYWVCSPFLLIF